MGLSKKNLGKLNTFIKNNNSCHHNKDPINSSKIDDPTNIFYSIIDNSENINQTSEVNQLLRKSEGVFQNINSNEPNYSKNLSIEDQLYDEFNYFLNE